MLISVRYSLSLTLRRLTLHRIRSTAAEPVLLDAQGSMFWGLEQPNSLGACTGATRSYFYRVERIIRKHRLQQGWANGHYARTPPHTHHVSQDIQLSFPRDRDHHTIGLRLPPDTTLLGSMRGIYLPRSWL